MTEKTQDIKTVEAGIAHAEGLIEQGEYNQAWWFLDGVRDAHVDTLEQDPNYGAFLEALSLALFKDDTLVQADAILDRLAIHVGAEQLSDRAKQLRVDIDHSLQQVQSNLHLNPLED